MAKIIMVINMAKKDIFVLKCCLLGDPGVGKTSLISQFVKGKFKKSYQLTVGLDVSSKDIILDDGRMARLSIHDIGGQERFNQVRHLFYQGAHVALLVFDVTRPLSLKRLENVWSKELMEYNQPKPHQPPLKTILVGNKIDLEDYRMVTREDAEKIAEKIKCVDYIEASAKDNIRVDHSFSNLTKSFLDGLK